MVEPKLSSTTVGPNSVASITAPKTMSPASWKTPG